MDIKVLDNIYNLSNLKSENSGRTIKSNNETFENLFQSALSMVNDTNNLTNAAEQAEISYALGLTDNTHDLQVAQQKANLSLQYTVAVRNKVLEAYKEIMNLQF